MARPKMARASVFYGPPDVPPPTNNDRQIIAETRLKWAVQGIDETDILRECVPPTKEECEDLAWVEGMNLAGPRKRKLARQIEPGPETQG